MKASIGSPLRVRVDRPIAKPTKELSRLLERRLGAREMRRRAFHMLPGFLPFLLWIMPHRNPNSVPVLIEFSVLLVAIAALTYYYFVTFRRDGERQYDCIVAVLGYSGSVLATMWLARGHVELAFAVLCILAFGDGSATLGGMVLGGPRLPWNHRKSWSGTASFVVAGTAMATLVYWGGPYWLFSNHPQTVPITVAILSALVTSLTSALVESIPSPINDNLRVGVTAAAGMILTHVWLVGS